MGTIACMSSGSQAQQGTVQAGSSRLQTSHGYVCRCDTNADEEVCDTGLQTLSPLLAPLDAQNTMHVLQYRTVSCLG